MKMSTFYETPVRSDELYHYGRSKRDGAPIGSGRPRKGEIRAYRREQTTRIREGKVQLEKARLSGQTSISAAKEARYTAKQAYRQAASDRNNDRFKMLNGSNVSKEEAQEHKRKAKETHQAYKEAKSNLKNVKEQNRDQIHQIKSDIRDARNKRRNAEDNIIQERRRETDPTWLYNNREHYTKQQLDARIERIKTENTLKELSDARIDKGKKAVDKAIDYGKTVSNALKTMQNINDNWDKWDGTIAGIDITGKKKHKHSRTMTEADYRKLKSGK